jgi:hypothetical protein
MGVKKHMSKMYEGAKTTAQNWKVPYEMNFSGTEQMNQDDRGY